MAAANGDPLRLGEASDSSTDTALFASSRGLEVRSGAGAYRYRAGDLGIRGTTALGFASGVCGSNEGIGTDGFIGSPSFGVSGSHNVFHTMGGLGTVSAVWGSAPLDTSHHGLLIGGRVAFCDRSGVLTIANNRSSVSASVPALSATTMVLATLQTNRNGVYIQAAVAYHRTGRITVYLNKKVTAATQVAYLLLDRAPAPDVIWIS